MTVGYRKSVFIRKNMKRTIITLCAASMMLVCAATAKTDGSYLPVVQRNGEKCYYYSAERGESVYGIVNKFGWDAETFMRYNPDASELKGGQVVYYPCVPDDGNSPDVAVTDSLRPAPSPAASAPVATQSEAYVVKEGESIGSIAKSTHTGVRTLFRGNPGLTPDNFAPGVTIRVFPGTDVENAVYRDVTEQVRAGQKQYKVRQKDTWQSIARKNHVDTTSLMAANPGVGMLRKGIRIVIPQFKDTTVTRLVPEVDSRVGSVSGLRDIYREVHVRSGAAGTPVAEDSLRVAVLVSCDDAGGRRRDLEFLRGFMLGLVDKDMSGARISLHGADIADYGSLPLALRSGDFDKADMIICSVDKNFPDELVRFCDERGIMLLNVFDAKTDISSMLPTGVQLLPPSSYFYDRTSDFLTRVMSDRTFLFVDYDSSDDENMSGAMMQRLKDSGVARIETLADADALAAYDFNPEASYAVISDAGSRDKISKTLEVLETIVDKYPNMPLSIVGRPNWMVYSSSLEKLFRKLDTYIPSRFLFDSNSRKSEDFTARYRSFFKNAPLKTMPMYSVMGFDVADYFVDRYLATGGDLNYAEPAEDMLQLDFRLDRPEMWSGLMNRRVYLLHFTPFSTTDKISL